MAIASLLQPINIGSFPDLPEIAWRGIFADYRAAMAGTTEASDVAHFGALWATIGATLGRSVHIYVGSDVYPNVYLIHHGESRDKKTTAQKRPTKHALLMIPEITEVGSPEGFADEMVRNAPESGPTVVLFRFDELSTILQRMGVLEFLSKCYDCPDRAGFKYRRKAVTIIEPTPTILTACTPALFWKAARVDNFHTGFLNRFLFLTGAQKDRLSITALPDEEKLTLVRGRLRDLHLAATECASRGASVMMQFTPEAAKAWDHFYRKDFPSVSRSDLLAAATRRLPDYVLKLALAYAAAEDTLPEITADQVIAAVGVIAYAEGSTKALLDSRSATGSDLTQLELEEHFAEWINRQQGGCAKCRYAQQTMSKRMSAQQFHRVIAALQKAQRIRIDTGRRSRDRMIVAL